MLQNMNRVPARVGAVQRRVSATQEELDILNQRLDDVAYSMHTASTAVIRQGVMQFGHTLSNSIKELESLIRNLNMIHLI